MPRLTPPVNAVLQDTTAELVRRNHETRLAELQALPVTAMVVLSATLPDATTVPVAHTLGRKPRAILLSPPRGPASTGRIEEVRDAAHDRSQVIALKATGFGATVTVDVMVF